MLSSEYRISSQLDKEEFSPLAHDKSIGMLNKKPSQSFLLFSIELRNDSTYSKYWNPIYCSSCYIDSKEEVEKSIRWKTTMGKNAATID